jgi:hypothetical protein
MNLTTESSIHLVTAIPGPRSTELQKRREANVPRGVASVLPVFVRRTSGATIEDVDGNQLLDLGRDSFDPRPFFAKDRISVFSDRQQHSGNKDYDRLGQARKSSTNPSMVGLWALRT